MPGYEVIKPEDIMDAPGFEVISPDDVVDTGAKPAMTLESARSHMLASHLPSIPTVPPTDTRTFQEYDPSNARAKEQVAAAADVPATIAAIPYNLGVQALSGVAAGLGAGNEEMRRRTLANNPNSILLPKPEDIVSTLAYEPKTEAGKKVGEIISWPFEKIAQGGAYLGGKTLETTGSPIAATAVDSAVNMIPFFLPFFKDGYKAGKSAVVNSDWYRTATIPERSLVLQSFDDARMSGIPEADLAKMNPEYFKEAIRRRATPENPVSEPVTFPDVEIPDTGITNPSVSVDDAIQTANAEVSKPVTPGITVDKVAAIRARLEAMRPPPIEPPAEAPAVNYNEYGITPEVPNEPVEIPSSAQINGSGSAQPGLRQESGYPAISGEGVRPGGQIEGTALNGPEANQEIKAQEEAAPTPAITTPQQIPEIAPIPTSPIESVNTPSVQVPPPEQTGGSLSPMAEKAKGLESQVIETHIDPESNREYRLTKIREGYSVSVKDLDSGEVVPTMKIFKDEKIAKEYFDRQKKWTNLSPTTKPITRKVVEKVAPSPMAQKAQSLGKPTITESSTYAPTPERYDRNSAMGPNDKQLVARDAKGKDIGRIWYEKKDGGIFIHSIDVEKHMRRQGVATQLMREATKDGPRIGSTGQKEDGKAFIDSLKAREPGMFREVTPLDQKSGKGNAPVAGKKAQVQKGLDRQKDDIIVAISKLGGLDHDQVKSEWGPTIADQWKQLNDHVLKQTRRFGAVFKKGGLPLDKMRETLIGHGYLPKGSDINSLHAAIDNATRGKVATSTERNIDHEVERRAQEEEARFSEEIEAKRNELMDEIENDPYTDNNGDADDEFLASVDDLTREEALNETGKESENQGDIEAAQAAGEDSGVEEGKGNVAEPEKQPWEMTQEEYVNPRFESQKEQGIAKGAPAQYVRQHDASVRAKLEKEHQSLVDAAISEGKPIPVANKPIWMRTQKEQLAYSVERMKAAGNPQAESEGMKRADIADHKEEVKSAIESGQPVPAEVLADYPELRPAPVIEKTDDAGGWGQSVGIKGETKAPTIGQVQKQGGRRVGTSDLMDNFTPEDVGLGIGEPGTDYAAERDVIITHNLTADNLLHADRMGGIAVPSLALTKKGEPITGFGEITLVGSRAMADPKGYAGTKVFGADAYSPRYPDVTLKFTPKAKGELLDRLEPWRKFTSSTSIDTDELSRARRSMQTLKSNTAFQAMFLDSKGIPPEQIKTNKNTEDAEQLKTDGFSKWLGEKDWQQLGREPEFQKVVKKAYTKKYADAGFDRELDDAGTHRLSIDVAHKISRLAYEGTEEIVDKGATREAIERQIKDNGLDAELEEYAEDTIRKMNPEEKIFQGFTYSGNKRYKPHTLANVVAILKKELRGGEGFNYGVGSLRAKFTPQFRSIEQIRKAKGRLLSKEDFDKVKDDIENELFAIVGELGPYSSRSKEFGFADTVVNIMEDSAKIGISRALKEYQFEDVPMETKQQMAEFLEKLRHMPTEYFEAIIPREVALSEFSGAVIPDNAPQKVRDLLDRNGLKIAEYKRGDDTGRKKAVADLAEMMDKDTGDIFVADMKLPYAQPSPGDLTKIRLARTNDQLSFDFREGTTNAEKTKARELLAATDRRQKSRPSVLGNAINAALRQKGVFNFVGQKITSPGDLAALAQVYRNPSFETLRYFFTKGDEIVGHTGVSSRLPNVSLAFEGDGNDYEGYSWMESQMDAAGADGYWLLHNHPSGNVEASAKDMEATGRFARNVKGFKGHVIIDHNKYGVVNQPARVDHNLNTVFGETVIKKFTSDDDTLLKPSVANPILGRKINSPEAVVAIGKELHIKDGHFILVTQSGAGIRGIMDVPVDYQSSRLPALVRGFARQTGAGQVFAIIPANHPTLDVMAADGIRQGYLKDAVDMDGVSMKRLGIQPKAGKVFGRPMTGRVVAEDETPYTATSPNFVKATTKAFIEKDIKDKLNAGGKGFIDTLQMLKHAISPTSGVKAKYLDSIMKMKGEQDKREYILEVAGNEIRGMFEKMPRKDQVNFIDRVKLGKDQKSPELQAIADMMRDIDTATWNEAKEFKPSLAWKENHYRVLWKVIPGEEKASSAAKRFFGGRRPLQGSKGFMKQATLDDMSQGIEMKGEPYSYNPWTMFSMAQADIGKFITAQRMWKELGELGGRKFVRKNQQAPENFVRLNDRLAKVYFPIEHYGKWIESELIKELKNDISEVITSVKEGGKSAADKVEVKVLEALESRGWSKAEAEQIIGRVKSAASGNESEVKTVERTVERILIIEKSKEFKPGKGFIELGDWWVDEGAGRILNNHLSRDYVREASLGRGLLAVKNNTTAMELALSLFHFTFETIETATSNLGVAGRKIYNVGLLQGNPAAVASGIADIVKTPTSPFSVARAGGSAIKYMADKDEFLATARGQRFIKANPQFGEMIDLMFHGGGKLAIHQEYKINSIRAMEENAKEGNYIGAMIRGVPALNEFLMKPLFELYIPRLKVGMFLKELPLRLQERASDIAGGRITKETLARQTWAFVEDRLGEMNFDNLFWNRTFKSAMQLTFRSVTWKLGNIRAMGGSAPEQMAELYSAYKDKRPPRLEPKFAWLLGLCAVTAALGTIIQRMNTGDNPESIKDLVYPRIGKNDRVATPTYIKDSYHLVHSPVGYVTSSMSGIWGRVAENWRNRDFYGQEIYGLDDNVFEKYAKEVFHAIPKPFSISSMMAQKEAGMPPERRALSFIGVNKAPGYISNTPAENRAIEIMDRYPAATRTADQVERSKLAKRFTNELREETRPREDIVYDINEAHREGKLTERQKTNIYSNVRTPRIVSMTRRFSVQEMSEVLKDASPEEVGVLRTPYIRKINGSTLQPEEKEIYRQILDDIEAKQ